MKKILFYLIVCLTTALVSYFTSCNVINRSRNVEYKTLDSASKVNKDSVHVINKDSVHVKEVTKIDSTGEKHVKKKQIEVVFDTTHAKFNATNPYHFNIGGTNITSPQPIQSALIDDNSEDDSSATSIDDSKDSTQVKSSDKASVKASSDTHVTETTKTVATANHSFKLPWWLVFVGIAAVAVGGYIIYKKR